MKMGNSEKQLQGASKNRKKSEKGLSALKKPLDMMAAVKITSSYGLCCCCLELMCPKNVWGKHLWMGQTEVYGDMMKECFDLTLSSDDKNMQQICEVCITRLRDALRFKHQVLECQKKLTAQVEDNLLAQKDFVTCSPNDIDAFEDSVANSEDGFTDSELEPLSHHARENSTPINEEADVRRRNRKNPLSKTSTGKTKDGRKAAMKRKSHRTTPSGHSKIESKYILPRKNVCLILEHSTICPFKCFQTYFHCFYCTKQYVSFDELKSHVGECHKNMTFNNIIKSVFRPNERVKADVSTIQCRICGRTMDSIPSLVDHLTETHDVKFCEDGANKPADSILGYDLSDGKYRCYVCKAEFDFFNSLAKHMNEHSSTHMCDVCGKCFILIERLRTHQQCVHSKAAVKSEQSPIKCEQCGKTYSTVSALRTHIRTIHENKNYMCMKCNETFPSLKMRAKHFTEVHGHLPLNLNCEYCCKEFSVPGSLRLHVKRIHLKIQSVKNFSCKDCGKKFNSRYSLRIHEVVHSGEKNFECEVCHKKYNRLNTLVEHVKIHRNDRRWRCVACGQAFVQKCSLKNHARVHHADQPFEQLILYKRPEKIN